MLETRKYLQDARYSLLVLAAGLMVFHLFLTDKTGDMKSFSISVIFWGAIASMIWDKKENLRFESDLFSTCLGSTLLVFALFKTVQVSSGGAFVQALPFIFALSLALIASGVQGLPQYTREILGFGVLALPGERFLSNILESILRAVRGQYFTDLTSQFSTAMLNLMGLPVELQDRTYLHTSDAVVYVHEGCSGGGVIDFLLRLSLLLMIVFSTSLLGKFLMPLLAIVIGFVVNGVRVMVMVFLVHQGNMPAFDYWHVGLGSQIFGGIGVILFGLAAYRFIQPTPVAETTALAGSESVPQDSEESS